ncbi:hypothetical protein ATM97_20425 [Nocardia sp. MH4]|uniref:hypothetical protein n=1 Tax=Nocardia TaxID=1817 RepID=UPI001C4EE312|nr:hypothetical protein [Nocardia sp. MH4]MBW0272549.1 hypothetical protein [Nocardia sp. MH4]
MKSAFSAEVAQAVGYVVLEAADAEDSIGELIVLRCGMDKPHMSWWQSGTGLADALESIGDPTLQPIADELRELLPLRHQVVHGLWLEGKGGAHLTMLRSKSTKKNPKLPGADVGGWSNNLLAVLAERFRVLDRMADDAISDAMGLPRSPNSLLPPRSEPVVLPGRTPRGQGPA